MMCIVMTNIILSNPSIVSIGGGGGGLDPLDPPWGHLLILGCASEIICYSLDSNKNIHQHATTFYLESTYGI